MKAPNQLLATLFATTLYISSLSSFTSMAATSASSWTDARTSPAVYQTNTEIPVMYSSAKFATHVPKSSKITQVYADRSYKAAMLVQTRLCWNGLTTCVRLSGESINTNVFNGLDADKPMYLVHTIAGTKPLTTPVFINGNVVVWFQ